MDMVPVCTVHSGIDTVCSATHFSAKHSSILNKALIYPVQTTSPLSDFDLIGVLSIVPLLSEVTAVTTDKVQER